MAPSKRNNPSPLFPSNDPRALAYLPAYNAFGDSRWARLAANSRAAPSRVMEQTPLLIEHGVAWKTAARSVETVTPISQSSGRQVEDKEPAPAPIPELTFAPTILLSRILAVLRALPRSLRSLFSWHSSPSFLLPTITNTTTTISSSSSSSTPPPSATAAAPRRVPSSQVDSEDFAPYSGSENGSELDSLYA
ncbi:hypothetical protein SVAN01_06715 [Stagonosporopsis vannaccii]|nr:hypothetical protein SVAN01_06715 [Stagonosporopsis vannaccii]